LVKNDLPLPLGPSMNLLRLVVINPYQHLFI
jgi:hypothetical protein